MWVWVGVGGCVWGRGGALLSRCAALCVVCVGMSVRYIQCKCPPSKRCMSAAYIVFAAAKRFTHTYTPAGTRRGKRCGEPDVACAQSLRSVCCMCLYVCCMCLLVCDVCGCLCDIYSFSPASKLYSFFVRLYTLSVVCLCVCGPYSSGFRVVNSSL